MKSEFDKYTNYNFTKIRGGHFCVEIKRFFKDRSIPDHIDNLERLSDSSGQLASEAIKIGGIDMLNKVKKLNLNSIEAKLKLALIGASYLLN